MSTAVASVLFIFMGALSMFEFAFKLPGNIKMMWFVCVYL